MIFLKNRLKSYLFFLCALTSFLMAVISSCRILPGKIKNNTNAINAAALKLTLPSNNKNLIKHKPSFEQIKQNIPNKDVYLNQFYLENKVKEITNKLLNENQNEVDKLLSTVPKYEFSHAPNEETFKITECLFGNCGTKCENFFVNNHANLGVDFNSKLSENLNIKLTKDNSPKVLVMHTHTSESYMDKDQGFYYKNTEFHSTNNKRNVLLVGDAICKGLENNGVKTIHSLKYHDVPMFTGSYKRSAETVKSILEKNPSVKIVLDIHRDTIEHKDRRKIKPTIKLNGKKAAQIMIIAGSDADGTLNHPDWEQNLSFALKLQKEIETLYPGLTRPLLFTHARYNQHLTNGSILIEVGSDANTLEEATYSGYLIGVALARVVGKI